MVRSSYINENMPPGGSSFGGAFHKEAFNAFVYPKPGARRTERQEHRAEALHPEAKHKGSVFFAMAKEVQKPSRLKAAVDKHNHLKATVPKSAVEQAMETLEARERERLASGEPLPEVQEPEPEAPKSVNKAWYPHASALRGDIRLSKPRCLDWGIDPQGAEGYKCPFWEGPRHRFDAVAKMAGARPETPTRSLRWRSAEDWDNPEMHAPLKITHTLPKSNSAIQLTRSRPMN